MRPKEGVMIFTQGMPHIRPPTGRFFLYVGTYGSLATMIAVQRKNTVAKKIMSGLVFHPCFRKLSASRKAL